LTSWDEFTHMFPGINYQVIMNCILFYQKLFLKENVSPILWHLSEKVQQNGDGDEGVDFYTRYKVRHYLLWVYMISYIVNDSLFFIL